MPQLTSTFVSQQRKLWFLVASTLLLLGGALVAVLYSDYQTTMARESERLLHQIRIIDANLTQQLQAMNAALLSVRQEGVTAPADAGRFRRDSSSRLRALSDAMPGVRTMLITDSQGQVLASNREEAIGFDVSQRTYFVAAKEGGEPDALVVSEPFKTTFNVYSLNLVKTRQDSKKQFAGIITATLDPAYFSVLLHSVLYTDDMRATLIHGSGKALLTLPANATIEGVNLAVPGSYFSQHMASGKTESLFSGVVPLTGDRRLVAYRTVRPAELHMSQPLLVAVSRGMPAILASWWQLVWVYGLGYVLAAVGVVVGVFLLQRQQKAVMELTRLREQEAREQAQRLELALGGADLGLWDADLVTGQRWVNARAREMVGSGPNEPTDSLLQWSEKVHPEDRAAAQQLRAAYMQGQVPEAMVLEYRVQHKDGHWVWLHSRGKVTHRGPQGEPLRIMGTYLDITERKAAEAQIAEYAFHDALTHLPNRRLLMDRLAQAQHASARSRQPGAVMFLDLDRFKWVNDTLGHDMGDELLRQVAARLRQCVRHTDTVARLGGDEFVLVIQQLGEQLDEATALVSTLADKVLAALREPIALGEVQHTVTTSIGIAIFLGEGNASTQLLKQADEALYQAKAQGRNSARIYTPGTTQPGTL